MLVSITRLRVRGWRFVPAFVVLALRSARQAKAAPGNVAVALLAEARRTFWTRTIWVDESAMRTFMRGEPHRRAMGKLANWCDEASVVHWTQAAAAAPSWSEAWRRMQAEGRSSSVDYPTPAHANFQIAAPRLGGFGGELRLK
jgi:hypothetical protein